MELIDDSTRRVEASEALTRDARASVDATLARVCAFTTPISNIDHSACAQLSGLKNTEQVPRARHIAGTYSVSPLAQVHDAIRQLDSISHQNARLVEQLTRSPSQMLHDTEQVSAALHIFRLAASETRALPDAVALRRAAKLA
ncbi:hypothetical protein DBR42_12195 [Pelomonas sp. HMWF004]|nr:hypothetical protein DBR42_12195 [Pelomonas sp. HMWF004]